ncbi:MAG TPA: YbaB/EbfC family nucleoid-associated protein [Anaerolineae bacterium]|nr:YbaB/EbfC family nucleoid-associated protein [Anaerolineae bacterium]
MAKENRGLFGSEGLLKQFKQIQGQLKVAQKELEEQIITAEVRGGAVKVSVSGTQVCKNIEIDPQLVNSVDNETLQELIVGAMNKALEKARKMALKKLGPLGGGLPGLKG